MYWTVDTGSYPIINSLKSASLKPSKIFIATQIQVQSDDANLINPDIGEDSDQQPDNTAVRRAVQDDTDTNNDENDSNNINDADLISDQISQPIVNNFVADQKINPGRLENLNKLNPGRLPRNQNFRETQADIDDEIESKNDEENEIKNDEENEIKNETEIKSDDDENEIKSDDEENEIKNDEEKEDDIDDADNEIEKEFVKVEKNTTTEENEENKQNSLKEMEINKLNSDVGANKKTKR